MARTNNLSNFLTDVAGAIREKKGSEATIPAANFDTEIRNLPSQGTYQHKTIPITQNGIQTFIPDSGYDAIDEVTINTAVPEKQLQTKSYTFQQNATLELTPDSGYDGFNQVNLNIQVSGGSVNNQDKTITENGTYTADQGYTGIGTATVNVPQPQNLGWIIPDSINVDMFGNHSAVPLFTIPKDFDGIIKVIPQGKGYAEGTWTDNSYIYGTMNIVSGTVTDAVTFNFSGIDSEFARLQVIVTKTGYNPIISYITVSKVAHNYGRVRIIIQQSNVIAIKAGVTFTCINSEDPSLAPVNVTLDTNEYWPTWDVDLPEGYWNIYFNYNGYTEQILTNRYMNADSMGYEYCYVSLPGYTFTCTFYINNPDSTTNMTTASGTITTYDSNDTVLATYSFDTTPQYQLDYTYVGQYDHYVINATNFASNDTITESYSASGGTSLSFSNTNSWGICNVSFDGNLLTTSQAVQTMITNANITVTEVDSEGTFIKNADYIVTTNQSETEGQILFRYNSNNYILIKVNNTTNYDSSQIMYPGNNYSFGTTLNVVTKQPEITINVTLRDIDGNEIPYADLATVSSYFNYNVGPNSYSESQNNGIIATWVTSRSTIDSSYGIYFGSYDDGNTAPTIYFSIATLR